MSISSLLCLYLLVIRAVSGKLIPDVFTGFSILNKGTANRDVFKAQLSFTVPLSANPQIGDYFELSMPLVRKVYTNITTSQGNWVYITDGKTNYAECLVFNGFSTGVPSTLTCTITEDSSVDVTGLMTIAVRLTPGMYIGEEAGANSLNIGTNTLTWNDMSATVSLTSDEFYATAATSSNFGAYGEAVPGSDTSYLYYLLGPSCASSFSENFRVIFSGSKSGVGTLTSCDDVGIFMASTFNDWGFPKDPEVFPSASYSLSCSGNTVSISASGIPANYHLFLNAYQALPSTSYYSLEILESVKGTKTCQGTTKGFSTTGDWIITTGSAGGTASVIHITTTTTTVPWTGLATSTYSTSIFTFTGTDGLQTTETIYYVGTPLSTTTVPWTGTITSTTTGLVDITGTDGNTTPTTLVIVETPLSTTTVPWTGTITSTTTGLVDITGTDGNTTPTTLVIVETPLSTTTVPWTGTITSTTTGLVDITGIDGNTTPTTLVIVETPLATTTVPWTGTITSTTTGLVDITGTDGSVTPTTLVIVETPLATTTVPWTGTITSTTTGLVKITGTDGNITPTTLVIVETPLKSEASTGIHLSTTTIPWTGSFTSISTGLLANTGSDGILLSTSIVYVETPLSTSTIPWSGIMTSTSTGQTDITGSDGVATPTTLVFVETPTFGYYRNSTSNSGASTTSSHETTRTSDIESSTSGKSEVTLSLESTTSHILIDSTSTNIYTNIGTSYTTSYLEKGTSYVSETGKPTRSSPEVSFTLSSFNYIPTSKSRNLVSDITKTITENYKTIEENVSSSKGGVEEPNSSEPKTGSNGNTNTISFDKPKIPSTYAAFSDKTNAPDSLEIVETTGSRPLAAETPSPTTIMTIITTTFDTNSYIYSSVLNYPSEQTTTLSKSAESEQPTGENFATTSFYAGKESSSVGGSGSFTGVISDDNDPSKEGISSYATTSSSLKSLTSLATGLSLPQYSITTLSSGNAVNSTLSLSIYEASANRMRIGLLLLLPFAL